MPKKNLLSAGAVTFICLFVLGAAFYKERAVFLDVSFHIFSIVHGNDFAIQNNRFAAFFTQLFPLFGSRIGLSLSTIAFLYTESFILLQVLTFFLIAVPLKNSRVAIAYLLFLVLMTTHTFFWIQSEMPQGLAFFFLFLALLDRGLTAGRMPNIFYFASPVLLFTFAFAHPMILFPFAFAMLFLRKRFPEQKGLIYGLLGAGVFIFAVKSVFMSSAYDQAHMSGAGNLLKLFPNYFTIHSNGLLVRYMLRDYYLLPVGLAASLYLYGRRRDWKSIALLAAFFFGYAGLVNISYPDGGDQFYFENLYLPLALIVGLPLAYDVLPALPSVRMQTGALGLACALCLLRIVVTGSQYTARLNWERSVLAASAAAPQKKWILSPQSWPKDTLIQSWGSGYEFWLLSTMEKGRSASIIIEEWDGEVSWVGGAGKTFVTKWGQFEYGTLNPKYFRFSDTSAYVKRVAP